MEYDSVLCSNCPGGCAAGIDCSGAFKFQDKRKINIPGHFFPANGCGSCSSCYGMEMDVQFGIRHH